MSPRRRLLIMFTATVMLVVLGAGGLRLLLSHRTGGPGHAGRPDQARPGAVVLVPGYGGSQGALSQLADRIRSTGRVATVVTLPGEGTGDLLVQADTLDAAVRRALAGGAPSVDVVGYSAGGVVTRLWVDRHDGAAVARRVVTLGSPLHGAQLAAVGSLLAPDACPAACRELVPGSELLAALDRRPLPAGLPWLSIWTENDQTVQPPESARLAGATNVAVQNVCPGAQVAHGDLPTDPVVTAMVLQALGTAPLAVPHDCAALRTSG